eukprot:359263-Amphidinium_carterae.1
MEKAKFEECLRPTAARMAELQQKLINGQLAPINWATFEHWTLPEDEEHDVNRLICPFCGFVSCLRRKQSLDLRWTEQYCAMVAVRQSATHCLRIDV